jgi:hypothetical protein
MMDAVVLIYALSLLQRTCERLRKENRRPFAIPVGGSNGLGTWGYLEAMDEVHHQLKVCVGLDVLAAALSVWSRVNIANARVLLIWYRRMISKSRTSRLPVGAEAPRPGLASVRSCERKRTKMEHLSLAVTSQVPGFVIARGGRASQR